MLKAAHSEKRNTEIARLCIHVDLGEIHDFVRAFSKLNMSLVKYPAEPSKYPGRTVKNKINVRQMAQTQQNYFQIDLLVDILSVETNIKLFAMINVLHCC